MARFEASTLIVFALTSTGCTAEVVRDDAGPGDGAAGGRGGGHDGVDIDPVAECEGLRLLMVQIPECKETWNTERCVTDLKFALEFGCLAETLASLRCYASTCADAERCRPQGDAFVACRDELQNEE